MSPDPVTDPGSTRAYPDAPWHLHGDLWLSLFVVRGAADRPDGLYGAAFVDYVSPSPLTYHELLVARLVSDGRARRAHITDIWVDSPASRDGGRALWAIPKDLADFAVGRSDSGPLSDTRWSAADANGQQARARFRDVSRAVPRVPFAASTWQRRETGEAVVAPIRGRARVLPAIASWEFHPDGPLAFLRGRRSIASLRIADFEMDFG